MKNIDATTADGVGNELGALVEDAGVRHIAVDLSGVEFLSSRAVGRLVELHTKARQAERRTVFLGLAPEIARMLHVMGLDSLFETAADVQEALRMLRE